MDKNIFELEDRTCDALVTGFLPSQPIQVCYNKPFYIPSSSNVCKILEKSLVEICGKKREDHFGRNIDWGSIDLSGPLNRKVIEGLRKSTSPPRDEYSLLDRYLSTCDNPLLEHEWIIRFGELYRYREGERKKAIERVNAFWNPVEMGSFRQIYGAMRKHTKELFEEKRK